MEEKLKLSEGNIVPIYENEKGKRLRRYFIEVENISKENTKEIKDIKRKIDVIIQKDYCLASDISDKHYYEDNLIAIVPDISKEIGYKIDNVCYKVKI